MIEIKDLYKNALLHSNGMYPEGIRMEGKAAYLLWPEKEQHYVNNLFALLENRQVTVNLADYRQSIEFVKQVSKMGALPEQGGAWKW